MCTACRRRSHGPPHQRTDLPPGAPQTILSTSRGMLEVAITLVRPTQHPSWHFCDHTGPRSSQTCHTSTRAGRQWELMWAYYPTERPSGACFHCQAPRHVGGSPQKHPPQTHLVALMVRRASAWPAARTRPARSVGWQGRKQDKPGLVEGHRLDSSTTYRAPVCVAARAGSSSSHPRATDGRRPSSLPLTAMHNFRPKRTNNAHLFRSIQRCREYHADGHDTQDTAISHVADHSV